MNGEPVTKLKLDYVPAIERKVVDPRTRRGGSLTRAYVTATGAESMDCSRAFATRDRTIAAGMIEGVDGGRVLEWMLSDGRING